MASIVKSINDKLFINSAGNVGIGTNSPLYKLNVIGDISFPSRNTAGTYRIGMGREDGSGWTYTQNIAFISDGGGGYITFSTQEPGVGGGEYMRLNYTGNLLIGTTTDSGYKLAVNGTTGLALSSGGIIVSSYDGNTGNIKPSVANGSVLISDDSGTTGRGTEFLNNGGLIASSTQSVVASFNSSVQDGIGWIRVNTTQQTTASGTSPAAIELVGLRGTSTHGRHAFIGAEGVDGTTYRTQIKFKIRPEDSPYQWSTLPTQMVIDGNGRVGINNAAPDYNLDVYATDTPVVRIQSQNSGGVGNPRLLMSRGGEDTFQINVEPNVGVNFKAVVANVGYMDFYTGTDAVTMRVSSSKNLLIGTTTDSGYKLRVNGTSYFDGLAHFGQSATSGSAFRWGPYGTAVSADTMLCMNQLWNGSGWTILNSGVGTTYLNLGGDVASPTIQFGTGPANTAATTKMIILNNGDVGIGTTAPSRPLHVVSTQWDNTSGGGVIFENNNAVGAGITLKPTASVVTNGSNGWAVYAGGPSAAIADGNLGFWAHGTNEARMVIQRGGNVGIGTTNPSYKLDVNGTGRFGVVRSNYYDIPSGTGFNSFQMGADTSAGGWYVYNLTTGTYNFVISNSGNVLIGTTSDAGYKLDVHGEILGRDDIRILNTYALILNGTDANWRIGRNTISDSGWLTSNTMQMVVFGSSSGQGFQVVNHNGTALFEIDGVAGASRFTNALGVGVNPSGTAGRIDASNDIVAYSTSDQRLKENITPIANALDKVKALTGVEFDWKEETKDVHGYEGHDVGVIAQEVQAVLPEAVRTNDSGYLSVRYEKMIALLVEANKELASRVEELEKKLK